MSTNHWYVYEHRKKTDGIVFYIGIGCQKKFKRAYSSDKRSEFWKFIVDKHGFIYNILKDNLSKEEAIFFEKKYISEYGRRDKSSGLLCNLTDGGDGLCNTSIAVRDKIRHKLKGKKLSEETKRKMSEARKGHLVSEETRKKIGNSKIGNQFMLGKKMTEEQKEKIRLSKLGANNPMFGKDFTNEHRIKLSNANKGENHPMFGKKHKETSKEIMSQKAKKRVGELNPFFGKTHSPETIAKILETKRIKKLLKDHKP